VKVTLIVVLSVIVLIALFALALWVLRVLADRWAVSAAKKYCADNNLEFDEVKAFPNHYGLYFKKDQKSYYAAFDFERNRTITWKKGTPQNKIEQKTKRNKKTQYGT
jgi:hypothetical protein